MRILFALPYVPSRIRVRPYHLVRELGKAHEVSVLSLASSASLAEADALRRFCDMVEVIPLSPRRAMWNCVTGAFTGLPLQAAICHSPEVERRLLGLVIDHSFDVVHIEHLRAARLARVLPSTVP